MQQQIRISYRLPVTFIKEGNRFIAYSPALDASTSGRSLAQAKERFEELARIFLSELHKKGTLDKALAELGWEKKGSPKKWVPPIVVSNTTERITV